MDRVLDSRTRPMHVGILVLQIESESMAAKHNSPIE